MVHRVALGHQTAVVVVEALHMDWDLVDYMDWDLADYMDQDPVDYMDWDLADHTDREVVDRTEVAEDTVKVVQAFQASLDQVQEEVHTVQDLCKSKY
jgi:hypothetical protein